MFELRERLESIDSTNDYLKRYVDRGVPRMVTARHQSAGKGRQGRRWYSPAGGGVYASFLIYPRFGLRRVDLLNRVAILAVVETLRRFEPSLNPAVKEPNDVYVQGRKICGILSELASMEQRILWAIIGVGVNLSQTGFPAELEGTAISLAQAAGVPPSAETFADVLADLLTECYNLAASSPDELDRLYGATPKLG